MSAEMNVNITTIIRITSTILSFLILPIPGHALTPGQIFDKVKEAIVIVKTLDFKGELKGFGSGVLISSDKIATSCHVVKGGASYQTGQGKKIITATLYAEDGDKDICILDAKGINGEPAQIGKAANLKVGDKVYAVGAPRGLELSLSDGIIAQLRGGPPPFIQTTAAISKGSSGGGLFDSEGRLVGLTTLYVEGGQSLNFAMPVEWIGEVKPGYKPAAEGYGQTKWLERAIALEQRSDWKGLLNWCKDWTKKESLNVSAWHLLGTAYDNLKLNDDAIDAFKKAISINPNIAPLWFLIGLKYDSVRRYNEAIDAYRQAIRIEPENADYWFHLGLDCHNINRHNEAIDAYSQAILINPDYNGAWNNLGTIYDKLKRYDEAIDAYRQALRTNSDHDEAWNNLGVTYINLKRYNDAIESYRQAIRINPKNDAAWHNLGRAYSKQKRYDEAIDAYDQSLRINPKSDKTWFDIGFAYNALNRHNDAIKAYRRVLSTNPEDSKAWHNLGLVYGNLKSYNNAIESFRRAIGINPEEAESWYNLGIAYWYSGNQTAAMDVVQKLRRINVEKADQLFDIIVPR